MDEVFFSIFTEASEDLGILYKSYEPILGITKNFLDVIGNYCEELNGDPFDSKIDLNKEIAEYKKVVKRKYDHSPIVISEIGSTIKKVKAYISKLDALLSEYAKIKKSVSYGGNYYRAIIKRPKVYSKDVDARKYETVNSNIRNVNRALDWVEKIIIDLFNMANQDLNVLTIVNRVYAKNHIYESHESLPAGVVDEDVSDSVIPMLPHATAESTWQINTKDKKSGKPPSYIAKNHDMANYIPGDGEDDYEPSIDDYKRHSYVPEPEDEVKPDEDEPPEEQKEDEKERQQAIQNYYYYTYNNSMNKNSNSFNKDNSTHDNHSRHVDDHSRHVDDHSVHGVENKDDDENEEKFKAIESFTLPTVESMVEAADDSRPKSDNPIRDTMMDVDSKVLSTQQKAKKTVQNVANTGRAIVKPVKRAKNWISNLITSWKDADETNIKERMADPHARSTLYKAVRAAIVGGALMKAGLLLNPIFLFLTVTRGVTKKKREYRLRNEMIGELKTEIKVTEEKIKDADYNHDLKAKYQLMRFKNELEKKLVRVGGGPGWKNLV